MAKRMSKVAYVLTPITFGGAERVSLNFLRSVDRTRFDVRPILLVRPWEQETYFAQEINRLGYQYETVPVARDTSSDPLRVPRVARRLGSILKQGAFDLMHSHGYFADICGLPVARCLGLKNISTCHGYIENNSKLRLYNYLDRHAIKLCQKVIAVSDSLKSDLIDSGVKASKIVVIPNAVPLPGSEERNKLARRDKRLELGILPDEYVVGYAGRLSAEKGVDFLIEAVARLHAEGEQVKLVIVGDGEDKTRLQSLVRQQGRVSAFVFAGFQTEIEAWMPAFDVMVLPSLTEGTPMALLEAMALGVPVIASAVGGIPRVVEDGMNGILVGPGNAAKLADKLRLLMQNQGFAEGLAANGVHTIGEKYSVATWCRQIERLYAAV